MVVAWAAVAIVLLILFVYEIGKWRSLSTEGARAAAERDRLTKDIRLKEEEIVKEMRANATLLQEMQWTAAGGDPSAFLTRFADLVQQKRMRILSIGALERSSTAQFSKSWHTVTVVAPFREMKELATRVESEKGILEDMLLEVAKDQTARPGGPEEVQTRFKMTALELTPDAKKVFERSMVAAGPSPGQTPSALTLPVPSGTVEPPPTGRDPFLFGASPSVAGRRPGTAAGAGSAGGARPPRVAAAPEAPREPKPEVLLELKGIVSFPGGYLAIVNNQIVKVGDTVSGHRVERITDNTVVFREPDGASRTVPLPDLVGGAPSGPRR
jgi:hypothetical protein